MHTNTAQRRAAMKRILLFTLLTFAATYATVFFLMAGGTPYGSMITQLVFMAVMFLPALCSLLTRLITRQGFGALRLAPHFRGNIRYYLIGWLLPGILASFGMAAHFLLFPSSFDSDFGVIRSLFPAEMSGETGLFILAAIIMMTVSPVIGGLLNLLPALGEELGWRGYLFPQLCKLTGPRPATVISGILWGLWHAPMIAMGHNYGTGYPGAPWTGIGAMTLFCILFGALLCLLTQRTDSVLPAALAHGALNAVAGAPMLLAVQPVNPFIGPGVTGIVGGSGILLVGVWCLCACKDGKETPR